VWERDETPKQNLLTTTSKEYNVRAKTRRLGRSGGGTTESSKLPAVQNIKKEKKSEWETQTEKSSASQPTNQENGKQTPNKRKGQKKEKRIRAARTPLLAGKASKPQGRKTTD